MAKNKNKRAAYYEHSSAKPVSSGLPFLLVAAAAATFVVLGHIAGCRRPGRRLGGKAGRCESSENRRNNGTQPRNLVELRAIHAAAAEARCRQEIIESSDPGVEQSTPSLFLTQKVQKLEEEVSTFLSCAKNHNHFVVDENIDQSVRSHQKMESERVQAMIFELDKLTGSATFPEY
ncbi:hypothetical protein O6H91_07G020400 [Diphasiastrum complanatum]|uniref:Uncharacterized protein n=1 Tax=Diphasiastrum complanatum TaxID=34168 RepID=A0ACC2D321_DIPCM|nr:hypothetical protein O6H91_07G020400 [Diphasiastrum complanatum]